MDSNTTFVKVKYLYVFIFIQSFMIQIQHLLKLNDLIHIRKNYIDEFKYNIC